MVFVCDQAIFKPYSHGLALPKLTEEPSWLGSMWVFGVYPPIHKAMIQAIEHTWASWAGPPCGFLRLEGAVGMVAERDIQAIQTGDGG
jgi:hypothetical protein